jgi:nitrate/nitrite transporter NarK
VHPVGKEGPDHYSDRTDQIGDRGGQPSLEIAEAEILDDRRWQPKTQGITGSGCAKIGEAEERKWNTALAFLVAASGLALSTYFPDPVHKMAVLSVCAIGLFAIAPLFWTLPTAFLSGTGAAGGIALINSIGNLAGFVAPYVMGYLKDATGGFTAGLLAVAFFPFLSAILVLMLGHNTTLEHIVAPAE